MKKIVSGLSFLFAFMLSLQNAYSSPDKFEFRVDFNEEKGVIAVQHFKNAPYPSFQIPFDEEVFNPATGALDIDGKTHSTRFFGGWFFIDLREENLSSAPLIVSTLINYGKNVETPLLQSIAKASCNLLETCEKQNLRNPYVGRSITAKSYIGLPLIPLEGCLVPTATPLESGAIRLVRSLAAVYGGELTVHQDNRSLGGNRSLRFKNGVYSLFSYDDEMISAHSERCSYLKGNFRETNDGEIANNSLRITCFDSWFKK